MRRECPNHSRDGLWEINWPSLATANGVMECGYEFIMTVICEIFGCASELETVNDDAIAEKVIHTIRGAIQSGSFASALTSRNSNVIDTLGSAAFTYFVAWGTLYEATKTPTDISGVPIIKTNTTDHTYYPVRIFMLLLIYQTADIKGS